MLSGFVGAALRSRSLVREFFRLWKLNVFLFFRSRLTSVSGQNLLALLASRVLGGHRDRQGNPEEVMLVVADASVMWVAASNRHVESLSDSAFDEQHVS